MHLPVDMWMAQMWCPQPGSTLYRWALTLALVATASTSCKGSKPKPNRDNTPVSRVVTLTPSATELVAAVGKLDTLVAVDRYSSYPPEVAKLPRVGDFLAPDPEAIVRLRPDLVVLDAAQGKSRASLERAEIRTLTLTVHSLADVRLGLLAVGEALDAEEAATSAVEKLDAAIAATRARARKRKGGAPSVLVVVDRPGGSITSVVAAGRGTYADDLLEILGARNVAAIATARYPKLSPEELLRMQPDVIIDVPDHGGDALIAGDWSELRIPAVQNDRVVRGDISLMAPGPRAEKSLRSLEAALFGANGAL